jgi:hypothetical protein
MKMVMVAVSLALVAQTAALAQGTRDPRNASDGTTYGAPRSQGAATGTTPGSDTMGGAFRGTGTPNLGTSPGMGSQPAPRRN